MKIWNYVYIDKTSCLFIYFQLCVYKTHMRISPLVSAKYEPFVRLRLLCATCAITSGVEVGYKEEDGSQGRLSKVIFRAISK